MNKLLYFKKKIDLLLISIEALDLYSSEKICEYNNSIKILNNSTNYNKLYFSSLIKYINTIHMIIDNTLLQQSSIYIIKQYNQYPLSNIVTKYLNKFCYLYYKSQSYYDGYSFYQKTKLTKIAMTNLYIISHIDNQDRLFYILKYLNI
uniref:Uncharacterized protein n=1 Tax=Bornetia secundiflora TaxID=2575637 RepID=A0A4D6WM47_9FLOR|nr:hypothetical protein [Bornetia secundiflora]